jgi:uncharacterized integral membrane protein
MRLFCLLVLLAFAGVVVAFALQNQQEVTLSFFGQSHTASVALIAGVAFLLGMFGGWSVVGLLRRSLGRAEPHGRG